MKQEILVTKASGFAEPFSIQKLKNSLKRSNASAGEIDFIIETIMPKLYPGISTKKIYQEAYRLLRKETRASAARYYLKKGILELGPSGFPFEKYIAELFKKQGFDVRVGEVFQGVCVPHEIDVLGEKADEIIMMECKYRNLAGFTVDVKTPLYIQSRFEDVLLNGFLKNKRQKFSGWITTNSKFTDAALAYGLCKGLKMFSWDYPKRNALKDVIDKTKLYPLTCLTSLTRHEKIFYWQGGSFLQRMFIRILIY